MRIDNATGLLIGLAVSVLGVVGCLYIIIRSVRKMLGGQQAPKRPPEARRSQSRPAGGGWVSKARNWLSEPVTGSPSRKATGPVHGSPASGGTSSEDGMQEVMRVLRSGTLGELVIEIEGAHYRRLVEIQDGAVGRRVLLTIQELNDFAGGHARRPLPEMHRVAAPSPQAAREEPDLTPEQQAFLAQLQEPPEEEPPPEPKPTLANYWRRRSKRAERQAAAEAAEDEPKSFVDEIEQLLQESLAGRSDMQGRSIHFKSTPMGDLRIDVDGTWYQAVDDVPDGQVKSLLRAAIQAWESQ